MEKRDYSNEIGKKYGRLTIIEIQRVKGGKALAICECDCGNTKTTQYTNLLNNRTKSCGCYSDECRKNKVNKHYKHNMSKDRLYHIWGSMKGRCYNSKMRNYKNYGGRGITVCDEWRNDFLKFKEWALKNGYNECLSIDRIDVNGNYEPSNCRWVTWKVQNWNKRTNKLTYEQYEKLTEKGYRSETIKDRMIRKGLSFEKAISLPLYSHEKA